MLSKPDFDTVKYNSLYVNGFTIILEKSVLHRAALVSLLKPFADYHRNCIVLPHFQPEFHKYGALLCSFANFFAGKNLARFWLCWGIIDDKIDSNYGS